MNSVFNPSKKLLEKSNNAKINFLRKNITETPPLKDGQRQFERSKKFQLTVFELDSYKINNQFKIK